MEATTDFDARGETVVYLKIVIYALRRFIVSVVSLTGASGQVNSNRTKKLTLLSSLSTVARLTMRLCLEILFIRVHPSQTLLTECRSLSRVFPERRRWLGLAGLTFMT